MTLLLHSKTKKSKTKKRNNKFTPSGTTFGVFWVDHSDFCSMKKKNKKIKKCSANFAQWWFELMEDIR